jgi:GH35 family endo-1,4-beta-xylanase
VEELLNRGTPLGGIGIQAHEPALEWYSPYEFLETLDFYAELGLPLHITEFIPQSSGEKINGWKKEGNWDQDAQAEFAEQIYRLSFSHPSVKSINWWGLSDRYIWQERLHGGLIDESYHPKKVYEMLRKLIREEWMTHKLKQPLDGGKINFRGFYGTYKVKLTTNERLTYVFSIHLAKNEANHFEFTL